MGKKLTRFRAEALAETDQHYMCLSRNAIIELIDHALATTAPSPEGAVEVKVHVLIGANGCYAASHSENVAHAWAGPHVATPHKHVILTAHVTLPTAEVETVEAEVEEQTP